MPDVRVLERVEELRFERRKVPRHIRDISRIVIREGEFSLLVGHGELAGLSSGHETVRDPVIIRTEHEAVRRGGEGHLIEMVADLGPLEIPGREGLVHAPAGRLELAFPAVLVTADQHHRNLRRSQQLDPFPLDGV